MSIPMLRQAQVELLLSIAADGECCAVYGLSNTGKSALLRALVQPESRARYAALAGRPGLLVYIDCNGAVELTSHGFYEIVVRSLLETLEEMAEPIPPDLLDRLRDHHDHLTAAASAFQASLAFTAALVDTCTHLEHDVVLLFDEFDEMYAELESRALLNLRALKDKFERQLAYITATVRPLRETRAPGDNEFAELFTLHLLPLGLLDAADARRLLVALGEGQLDETSLQRLLRLGGGHLGLLTALAQTAARAGRAADFALEPNVRIECLKVWNQLQPEEQAALQAHVTEAEAGLLPQMRERLQTLGVVTPDGQLFSELFTAQVRRHSAAPAQSGAGVVVDEDAGEVWVDGLKITVLTDLEYRLMRLLHQRRDRLTTKEMIVEAVWGGQYFDDVDDARIEKLVSRLRAKVEPDPARPRHLLTQRGRGYKLLSQPSASETA